MYPPKGLCVSFTSEAISIKFKDWLSCKSFLIKFELIVFIGTVKLSVRLEIFEGTSQIVATIWAHLSFSNNFL